METFIFQFYAFSVILCGVSYSSNMIANGRVPAALNRKYGTLIGLIVVALSPIALFIMMWNFEKKSINHTAFMANSLLTASFCCNYFLRTETSQLVLIILSASYLFLLILMVIGTLKKRKYGDN